MTKYESLLVKADSSNCIVVEVDLGTNKPCGKCIDNIIIINNKITEDEKACILAEELGHYLTTYGDITDQSKLVNKKQELLARRIGYRFLIEPIDLVSAFRHGAKSRYEISEYLNISEPVLDEIINDFKKQYGIGCTVGNYYITFEPYFGITRYFG